MADIHNRIIIITNTKSDDSLSINSSMPKATAVLMLLCSSCKD